MLDPHDPSDKRPKLERARSAAEKENNPMQRANSQLRRQYSQQDPPTRRLSQSDGSGMDMMMSPGHHQQQIGRMQQMGHGQVGGMYGGRPGAGQQGYGGGPYGQHSQLPQPPMHHGGGGGGGPYGGQHSMTPQVHITHAGGGGYGHDDPSYYQVSRVGWRSTPPCLRVCVCHLFLPPPPEQSEIEDLMRTHPHLVHPRQQQHYAESLQSSSAHGSSGMGGGGGGVGSGGMHLPPEPTKSHKRPLGGPYLPQQRSFSSSDEDIRSTPEFEGKFGVVTDDPPQRGNAGRRRRRRSARFIGRRVVGMMSASSFGKEGSTVKRAYLPAILYLFSRLFLSFVSSFFSHARYVYVYFSRLKLLLFGFSVSVSVPFVSAASASFSERCVSSCAFVSMPFSLLFSSRFFVFCLSL